MTYRERIEQEFAKRNELVANNNDSDQECYDTDYFGIDNIKSFPACLDLRLSDSSRVAIPYGFIQEVLYNPAEGIEITTDKKSIKVIGRDLEKLFDYLTAFRVRYIRANVGTDAAESGLFVETIDIGEKQP